MALQKNIEASTGVVHNDAYIKVYTYSSDNDNVINARLRAYASRQHALDGMAHLEGSEDIISFVGDYSDNAHNAKKQIYEHAKTLQQYENAIDVFE